MQSKYLSSFKVLAGLATTVAIGATANAQTVGNLSQIQGETLILKARANRAAAQIELENKNRMTIGEGDLPMIRARTNVAGKRSVILVYGNGSTIEAKVGDAIPGGYVVSAITEDGVDLAKGGKTYRPARQPVTTSTATVGQPSIPGAQVPAVPLPR